ncbi:hypothetical protein A5624_23150 [Mycobacterium sp. 1482292.6]|nr:hypothetical protein A5624_23150 [Mycobacterium sp. 1482292.6]
MPGRDHAVNRDSWRIVDSWFSQRAAADSNGQQRAFLCRDTGSRLRSPRGADIRQMTGQLKMRSSP